MMQADYRYKRAVYPQSIAAATVNGGEAVLEAAAAMGETFTLALAGVRPNVLRVRIFTQPFTPDVYSFVEELPANHAVCTQEADSIVLTAAGFTATVCKSPFSFVVTDPQGQTVYRECTDDVDSVGEGENIIPPMGYTQGDKGVLGFNFCCALRYNEHIFGLGERFTEFDRRGQQINIWNYDTLGCRDEHSYKNIPFYISSLGYGLLVNSCRATQFNIGFESNAALSVHVPDHALEYYIIVGEMKEILRTYTALTGPAALPPDWSFGLWYSNGFKDASRELMLRDAAEFRKRGVPCDVMHFDCYWLREDMWCDFEWNEAMYPNHVEMLRQLHNDGYKICLWINPYVTIRTQMYAQGDAAGYFIKKLDGTTYTADMWHGLLSYCALLDVTNPQAVEWFRGKLRKTLAEGVDVLKTDFGEDIPVDSIFYNGKTGEEMRNIYANLYNAIVFDAIREQNGQGLVWGRSGTAGMQKFPVCWSGDPRSCFEGMAGTLRAGLSMAMSGVPFWSHDMGGFYGKVSDEVFVRWSQFGLFTSHSRLHGTSSRQPWAFSEAGCAIVCRFITLRYRLMPYILKTARRCVADGLPFLRPLALEHPKDCTARTIWDEYYFGEDILVAPVFGGDNSRRQVYLPCGGWTDLLTGKEYAGGCWHELLCPLDYMPVFYKSGCDLGLLPQAAPYIEG